MKQYPIGDLVLLQGNFRDPRTYQPRSPSNVVCKILSPSRVLTQPATQQLSVGQYVAQFTPTEPGIWYARWEGTGSFQAAMEDKFEVEASAFATGV